VKIIHLSKKLPFHPKDGEAVAITQLLQALNHSNHNIFSLILNIENKDITPYDKKNNFSNFKIINQNTKIKFFQLLLSDIFSSTPYIAKRFLSNSYLNNLIEIINDWKPDLIIADSLYTAQYFKFIKASNCIKIYRAHNIEFKIWQKRAKNSKNLIKKLYSYFLAHRLKNYEHKIANISDKILTISTKDTEYWSLYSPNKKISYLPVTFDIYPKKIEFSTKPDFIFLGSLDWYPNIEALDWFINKVWLIILTKIPNAKLHIAGKNANKNWVEKLKTKPNILFYGEINSPESYLSKGKILISPLFSGSGIRIKILEALSLGLPIVASSLAIKGLELENNENIVIANNKKDFSNACINLFSDKLLWEKLAIKGKKFIKENFSSEIIDKKLNNFILSLEHKQE